MTRDLKSLQQGRCPVCDSADFGKVPNTKHYECIKCGRKFKIQKGKSNDRRD